MSQQTPTPTVGRIVHYVLGEEAGSARGEVRAAIVTAVRERHDGKPNLQVLLDGPNDQPLLSFTSFQAWREAVPFGGPGQLNTWFLPPRV